MSSPRRTRPRALAALAAGLVLAGAGVAVAATITGTPGKDRLKGTPRADVMRGLGGNDVMQGFGGNDRMDGGAGNDIVVGYAGNDLVVGGVGNDILDGREGNDRILGGAGDDTHYGGAGRDVLDLGPGDDNATGGAGNDRIIGGGDTDVIQGAAGADVLDGGDANDLIDAYDPAPGKADRIACGPGPQDLVMGDTLDQPPRDCEAVDRSDDPRRMVILGFAGRNWVPGTIDLPAGWVKPGETFTCGPGGQDDTLLIAFTMYRGLRPKQPVLVTWRLNGDIFNSTSVPITNPGTGVESFATRFGDRDKPLPNGVWEGEVAIDGKVQSKLRFRRACG